MIPVNSVGNLMNGGLAVRGENWIFFANGNDGNKLYKMRPDGHGVIKISEDAVSCLNLLDNQLYYHNNHDEGLYRIDINGQNRMKIIGDSCWNVRVRGKKIYFTNLHGDNKLCQVDLDGNNKMVLTEKDISGFSIVEEYIYITESTNIQGLEAVNNLSSLSKLFRLDLQGKQREFVLDGVETFNIFGDWLYFVNALDNYALYKMRLDSTQQQKISGDVTAAINVAGDWVYYINVSDNSKLYKIKIDGTQKIKLSEAIPNNINVVSPWIFFEDVLNDYKICNIRE